MKLMSKLDRVIKEAWLEDIKKDYDDDYLLLEDSVKCSFYYNLRRRLGDGWLKKYRLRIIPEYHLFNGYRADIAIVKLVKKHERGNKHLSSCVESVISIIELKHKNASVINEFYKDRDKLHIYSKEYPNTQLYTGFIHEEFYNKDNSSWFDGRQINNWAKGRVCELLGYWSEESDDFVTEIKSYNKLNEDLKT